MENYFHYFLWRQLLMVEQLTNSPAMFPLDQEHLEEIG